MTTRRFGVYTCQLMAEEGEFTLWAKPLDSNYYVLKGDVHVAYIGSGPKSHYYVSIFKPKDRGAHYSFTTEHSDIIATFDEIIERVG